VDGRWSVDRGCSTRERAADIDALRPARGAEQSSLWGIGYGSHLVLATLKSHGATIHRGDERRAGQRDQLPDAAHCGQATVAGPRR